MISPGSQHLQPHLIADLDDHILNLLDHSVPICERPYLAIAQDLQLGEMALLLRIQHLRKEQRISRNKQYTTYHSIKPASCNRITALQPPILLLSSWDQQLMTLLNQGLPLSSRPFHIFAKLLDLSVDEVLFRAQRLENKALINRIGPAI